MTALPPLSARILTLGEDNEPTMAMAGDFHFGESGFSHAVRASQESDPCPPMRATSRPGTADPAGPRFKGMDLARAWVGQSVGPGERIPWTPLRWEGKGGATLLPL